MIAFMPALALHSAMASPVMKPKTELCVAFCRQPRDLFVKDVDRAGGKHACGQRKMRVNRRGVGDQSVERDERRNGGKDRQQRKEDDATRDSEQPVVVETRIDAPEDVLPSGPGDLPRNHGMSSPARLLGAANLGRNRLVVLDLLLRPLVGDQVRRRRGFARSLATLVRRGIDRPVRLTRPVVALVLVYSVRVFAKNRGNRGSAPIEPKAAKSYDAPPLLRRSPLRSPDVRPRRTSNQVNRERTRVVPAKA